MNQYFVFDPSREITERELNLDEFGHSFRFITCNGLFSCDEIDFPSLVLLRNIPAIQGDLLDLGCGYGLIGIVLAKLNNVRLTQSDVNPLALRYSEKNAELNGIATTTVHSDCFAGITDSFDTIILNPPIHAGKDVCYRMYEEAALHLNPGGSFYIVIQKKHGASSTLEKLGQIFSVCEVLYRKKGINVLRMSHTETS